MHFIFVVVFSKNTHTLKKIYERVKYIPEFPGIRGKYASICPVGTIGETGESSSSLEHKQSVYYVNIPPPRCLKCLIPLSKSKGSRQPGYWPQGRHIAPSLR